MAESHEAVFTFLNQHKLGILSTASEKGKVWGAAIYYIVDRQLNFYFVTHVESKKYHNLKQHPQVALTIADDDEQATVQVSGEVSELPIGEEFSEAYRKLTLIHPPGQYSWVLPVSEIHDQGTTAVLKLTPEALQFSNFKLKKHHPDDYVSRVI